MANTPNVDLENINVLPDTSRVYDQIVSEVITKTNNNATKIDAEINANKTNILLLQSAVGDIINITIDGGIF